MPLADSWRSQVTLPSFEALFRAAPNPYVLLDPAFRILDANQAYLEVTGRTLEHIRGRRMHEAFPPDPDHPESGAQLLASLERVLVHRRPDTLPVIRYAIAAEGGHREERYWSATHVPFLGPDGKVCAILQNTTDITEMVRQWGMPRSGDSPGLGGGILGRALTAQGERDQLRQLFAQAPGFVCLLRGPDHVFELANEAYLALTGHRPLIGRPAREALPEIVEQSFIALFDEVYATGKAYRGHRQRALLRRGGEALEEVFVDFVLQPIVEHDGQVSGLFVQGHDVTQQHLDQQELERHRQHLESLVEARTAALRRSEAEREAAEAALYQAQKLEAVGRLTGGIAHTFNNLLQVIGGNLQLLRRSVDADAVAVRRLESAASSVERGARLASQLLAFASRQPLQPRPLRLDEQVAGMLEMLSGVLGQGIRVDLDLREGIWPVLADQSNLETLVLNLVTNAGEAMGGAGRLEIRVENVEVLQDGHPRPFVRLSVLDEGGGMSEEVRSQAFEPFFTTRRARGASGLGLSMVYGFVRQSGGFVELLGREPHGTVVQVHLPRHEEAALPAHAPSPPPTAAVPDAEAVPGRILFVEDDPTLRMLTGEVMTELGYQVSLAESAEEALGLLARESFDVLFTDIGLPGMSGLDLARQVAERYPALRRVIASGYAVDVQAERLGDTQCVLKPYDIDRVRTLLDGLFRAAP